MNGGGSATMVYGVPVDTWNSWAIGYDGSLGDLSPRQSLYLQEYNRTDAQQNYADNLGVWEGLAYAYTGIIDNYTGWEAVETGEKTNKTIEEVHDAVTNPVNQTVVLAIGLGALYLALR